MKTKHYSVKCSNGNQLDSIDFFKNAETGMIEIGLGHEQLPFTRDEIKELIDKLKCVLKD